MISQNEADAIVLKRVKNLTSYSHDKCAKLSKLYDLNLDVQDIWACLSRLVRDGKVECVGSNRNKSYRPLKVKP